MKRTIAAILAADVAGFSRLVADDEDDTLRRLAEYSRIFREEVAKVRGRVFNTAGDAILAEFPSAVEALRAGIAIQETLRSLNQDFPPGRRILFRMGLNIGDVVETDGGDLLGDGVNVAARLEGTAEPGGICLSRSVHEAIAARVAVGFRDIGPQTLKNIPRPVHAFRVVLPSDGSADEERSRWPRLAMFAALLLLALGGGIGLAVTYDLLGKAEEPDRPVAAGQDPADRTDLLTVGVAKPHRACFKDEVWMAGILTPRTQVEVGPDADGLRVLRVLVAPMDKVAIGQVLAELARPEQPDQIAATIRAPVAGTVAQSNAVVGAPTSLRAPPLFRIVGQGAFELAADVPVKALARLAPGQGVSVTPLGMSEVQGRIRSVSTEVDGATQMGRVRVQMAASPDLREGLFARGVATVAERCGIGVPSSSILHSAEGDVVYVSNDGRVEGRLVATGLTSGENVEIRSGLGEGDAIVLRSGPFVREGDTIRPVTISSP